MLSKSSPVFIWTQEWRYPMQFRRKNNLIIYLIIIALISGSSLLFAPQAEAAISSSKVTMSNSIIKSLRASYDKSLADAIVGRAIWYMEYGFIKYGHSNYADTGYCDCSQFIAMVYRDFGFACTSASRKYDQVGVPVRGVYVRNGKMYGVDNLRPGDIFTFQRSDHITHVAMYIGVFEGKPCFIGTTSGYPTAIGIVKGFDNWYGDQFHGVRRILTNSAYQPGGRINDRGPVIPDRYRIKPTRTVILPKKLPTGF